MAIVDVKNIPSSVFDQVIVINDLIQTLRDTPNFNDIINQLRTERDAVKKQYDDLAILKAQDDQTTKALNATTAVNNASISALQTAQANADQSKTASDASANKAAQAQKSLSQAQADFDEKTAAANADLDKRTKSVSEREAAAAKAQADADDMKSEYQDKLDNIKKLAGG